MSKAFTRESDSDDDEAVDSVDANVAPGTKNYLTRGGYERLKKELLHLIDTDRPEVVRTVSWAASNGDRSENGDYIYGKRRLREIDRRIRFLTKRLDIAEVVDVERQDERDRVFFGATVTYLDSSGVKRTITIVGVDETDPLNGRVSWIAPIARAFLKAREGDIVSLRTPSGIEDLEIIEVSYQESESSDKPIS